MNFITTLNDPVDIVVLNDNDDSLIQRCTKSIRENTSGLYKLIVVDQGSTDGSTKWLEKSKIASHLILNKKNVGRAHARNQAIRVGSNPWIALINSNIEIRDSTWIDKMFAYADKNIGVVYGKVDPLDKIQSMLFGELSETEMSFMLISRKCFNEVGYFDKRFYVYEHMDWLIRFEWSWWKDIYCPDTNIVRHSFNMTREQEDDYNKHKKDSFNLLSYKYTNEFVLDTLNTSMLRRYVERGIYDQKM